jgi:hypothetical protein
MREARKPTKREILAKIFSEHKVPLD